MREALYAKANVLAFAGMDNFDSKVALSSDDILMRLLQKAEDALEEVRCV